MSGTAASLPGAAGAGVARSLSWLAEALSGVTYSRLVHTFLFCLLWTAVAGSSHVSHYVHVSWGPLLNYFLSTLFNGFAVMLALTVADRASAPPLYRWWPYAVAVVVGVAAGATSLWFVSQRLIGVNTAYHAPGGPEPFRTFAFRHALHGLVVWSLVTVAYVAWRRASQRLARLRAVQLERAEAEKQVLKSRLAAMQARVEPRFLLDALARVERLYETDTQSGDRMLRELVLYLRAAIPQAHDATSTLAREIGLASAYLNVIDGRTGEHVRVHTAAGAPLAAARVPPMVMLPLLSHALARRGGRASIDECFEVRAAVSGDRLRVTIADPAGGLTPAEGAEEPIRYMRERLATLYGSRASLTLRALGTGSEAVIELPYEAC